MDINGTVGFLKFFKDRGKLDSMLNGLFYCNTPEYYRTSGHEGVSDVNESCNHAYRRDRNDEPVKLTLNGIELEELTALTIHNNGIKDKYLHCWFAIRIPQNNKELDALTSNIKRMRKEFGNNYAFIKRNNLIALVNRLKQYTTEKIDFGNIKYSDDKMEWSVVCKSHRYSYQQEFRFIIGDCNHTDTMPLKIECKIGFTDLIEVNQAIQILDNKTGHVWFHLDTEKCCWNEMKIE